MQIFSADATMFLIFFLLFDLENIKNPPQKVAYLRQLGVFFSLQHWLPQTAQNFISVL